MHLEKSEIPDDYVALGIEIGRRQVRSLSMESARKVASLAGPTASVEIFRREFYGRPVLRVPSVIIPREHNYILPAAPDFDAHILWMEAFEFDSRLFSLPAEA